MRCFGARISSSATVGRNTVIIGPWNLTLGEKSMIGTHSWIMCFAPVEIGDHTGVGEYVKILTGSHDVNSTAFKGVASSVVIGRNAWVASGAMLVSGGKRRLKIGDGAVVAAGSVVFSNVRSMAVVVGNPAEELTMRTLG